MLYIVNVMPHSRFIQVKINGFPIPSWFYGKKRNVNEQVSDVYLWNYYFSLFRNGIWPTVGKTNIAYFPDKFADKEIAELKVICPNKGNGCIWNASLKLLNVRHYLDSFFCL